MDYQSLLSMITAAVAGIGVFYYFTIGPTLGHTLAELGLFFVLPLATEELVSHHASFA